jgi:signal peptidase I
VNGGQGGYPAGAPYGVDGGPGESDGGYPPGAPYGVNGSGPEPGGPSHGAGGGYGSAAPYDGGHRAHEAAGEPPRGGANGDGQGGYGPGTPYGVNGSGQRGHQPGPPYGEAGSALPAVGPGGAGFPAYGAEPGGPGGLRPRGVNGHGPRTYEPQPPPVNGTGLVETDSRYAGPKSTGHLVYEAEAGQSALDGQSVPAYPVLPETSRSGRGPADPLAARSQTIYPAYPDAPPQPLAQPTYEPRVDEATEVLRRYVPANELLTRETEAGNARPRSRKHPTRAIARRRARRRRALEWPFLVAFALVAAFLIRTFAIQTFYIPSGSMHETLLEGDRVLVNKVGYHLHEVHRGDVVVFRRPPDFQVDDDDLIKRVVALPGETVQGKGRKVLVNGKALNEPYVEPACKGTDDFRPVTVPAGKLWVMGDNRCDSSDSRVFGPIDRTLVVGRAFVLAWPPGRVSWL